MVMFASVMTPIGGVPNAVTVVVFRVRLVVVLVSVVVVVVVVVDVVVEVEVSVTGCMIDWGVIRIRTRAAASIMEITDRATILVPTPLRSERTSLSKAQLH